MIASMFTTRVKRALQTFAFKPLGLYWTLSSGVNIQILSRSEWGIYNDIFVDQEYDTAIARAISVDREVRIVDIGANVGFFALRCFDFVTRHRVPCALHVSCVEGSAETCARLAERIRSQNFRDNVVVHRGLVGSKQGSAKFGESHNRGLSSILSTEHNAKNDARFVPFVDLTTLLPCAETIHLIKCDIEGAELMFIESYPDLLEKTAHAVFEFHHRFYDVDRAIQLLAASGLRKEEVVVERGDTSVRLYSRL